MDDAPRAQEFVRPSDPGTDGEVPPVTPRQGGGIRSGLLRVVAALFSVGCLGWVVVPLIGSSRELLSSMAGGRLLVAVLVAAVAYWAACSFLALGWWWLVGIYGTRPSLRGGYAVFARSQLAKYLPGNAFHLVSRQVLGRQLGLGHAELVASGFLEVGTQLLAALVVAGTLYGLAGGPAADHLSEVWPWVLVVSLVVLFAWPAIDTGLRRLPRVARWLEGLPRLSAGDLILLLGPALFCYVLFFVATGGILLALVSLLEGPLSGDVLGRTLGIYPLAWTAGMVTVGAPAGVGVREAVLMLELESWMPTLHASAAALAFRLVTLGGDLLTAMVGQLIKKD